MEPRVPSVRRRHGGGAGLILLPILLATGARANATLPSEAPGEAFWGGAARSGTALRSAGAPQADDGMARWFFLGIERTRQRRYAEAAAAYGAALAAGADASAVYANLAEVLMADGHLTAAVGCYRDAIASASAPGSVASSAALLDDPRARAQDLVLATFGLAVALDRDEQPLASLEAIGRALALDPKAAVLEAATVPSADLFFVPDGDVFYYLGLARAAAGRRADALAAYREFLARVPGSRWARRAEAHVAELTAAAKARLAPDRPQGRGPRVLAAGTVLATGGAAAPLIDAAWRDQLAILDDCLDETPPLVERGRAPLRIAIELAIDGRGRVTAATAKLPIATTDDRPIRCLEHAVVTRLRLPPPPAARPTRARTELLVGFPSP